PLHRGDPPQARLREAVADQPGAAGRRSGPPRRLTRLLPAPGGPGLPGHGDDEQAQRGEREHPPRRLVVGRPAGRGPQGDDDGDRDRRVVADDEVVPEEGERPEPAHHDTSTVASPAGEGWAARSAATVARLTASVIAISTRIAPSEPGQCAPAPSAPQNV